jgi:hypothetical protein
MIVKVEIIKNQIVLVAYKSLVDLEGVKLQLEKTLGTENVQRQLSRQKSSDSGSLTGSLSRSIDGSESKLRRRHSDKESSSSPSAGGKVPEKKVGEKLIEVEKSQTGSVRNNSILFVRSKSIFF